MPDEEFLKLRIWLDAELALTHNLIALVLLWVAHGTWMHVVVILYIIWNLFYAARRINWLDKRHKGYTDLPR